MTGGSERELRQFGEILPVLHETRIAFPFRTSFLHLQGLPLRVMFALYGRILYNSGLLKVEDIYPSSALSAGFIFPG